MFHSITFSGSRRNRGGRPCRQWMRTIIFARMRMIVSTISISIAISSTVSISIPVSIMAISSIVLVVMSSISIIRLVTIVAIILSSSLIGPIAMSTCIVGRWQRLMRWSTNWWERAVSARFMLAVAIVMLVLLLASIVFVRGFVFWQAKEGGVNEKGHRQFDTEYKL